MTSRLKIKAKPGKIKPSADTLIQEATSVKYKLTAEQREQVRIILSHNDRCDTPKKKVPLAKAWRLLKDHYGLKMGIHMLEKLVCDDFERTKWGQL